MNAAAKDKMCDYHFNMIYHYIYKYFEDLCNHNSWKHSRSNTFFCIKGVFIILLFSNDVLILEILFFMNSIILLQSTMFVEIRGKTFGLNSSI